MRKHLFTLFTLLLLSLMVSANERNTDKRILDLGHGIDVTNVNDVYTRTVSVAEFNAATESTDVWYQLTGTVTHLEDGTYKNSTTYGNFDLVDSTGSVYVYGVVTEKGGAKAKFADLMKEKGIKDGSTITIIGNRGSYNGKIEVTNAYFVSVDYQENPIDEYQETSLGYLTVPYDVQISVDYTYYNYACEQNSIAGGTWTQNWGSFENDIYKHKSNPQLSQVEFESKYDSLLVSNAGLNTGIMEAAQPVVGGALQQFILKFNTDGTPKKDANGNYVIDRPATEAEYLGNITVKTGTNIGDGTKTQVLTWAITAAQMKYWLITKHLSVQNTIQKKYKFKNDGYLASAKSSKEYRAVKYQVVDATDNTIRDIYVVLYTGDLKITPNNDRATAKAVFDTYKIEEYWYKENTQTTAKGKTPKTDEANLPYWREAHLNVPSPEDWQPTWQNGAKKPFEFLLSAGFNKGDNPNWMIWESDEMLPTSYGGDDMMNKPHFDEFFTVTDITPYGDFNWSKHFAGYTFEFHEKNAGAQFKGLSGTTYTLSLGSKRTQIADGIYKDLDNWALLATANGKTDTVAYLEYKNIYTSYAATNSVNNINIVLKKKPSLTGSNYTNSYAEDLLNYCKYDELDDNDLEVLLGVRLHYDGADIVADGEIQVRFLRPVNLLSEDKTVQNDGINVQEIMLYDIIKLTDWRDQWNPQDGYENMVNKPRRTLVDGTPFNFMQDGNKWTVDYWYYYNIKEILVGYDVFKNSGEPLNDIMTSNMNNNPSFKPLNQISNNVEFTYLAPTNIERTYDGDGNVLTQRPSWIGDPHFYGSILFKDNRSTVDDFDVTVPITVVYEWGAIYKKDVTIHIRRNSKEPTVKGDVNGDGSVNGTDLVALTNIILGKSEKTTAADVNGDGQVNGTDYVALVNIILGRSNARSMSKGVSRTIEATCLSIEPFDIKAGETKEMVINLTNSNDEITLVQFDLSLPAGLSIKKVDGDYDIDLARTTWKKHSLDANAQADGYTRLLLASSSNAVLSGTEGAIITVTLVADNNFVGGDISLDNILMVTPDEQETKQNRLDYHVGPTGIQIVSSEVEQGSAVYNLSGQRQSVLRKGINIVNGKKIIKK